MPKAISVRLDDDAQRALALLERGGRSRSDAIRIAILEAAARRRRADVLRAEVAEVAADPEDRQEMARVLEVMEDLVDPW
jgi:hypothetical protein